MFSFIKQVFIVLLSFSSSLACTANVQTKCLSLNNQPCMVRPTLISAGIYLLKVNIRNTRGRCEISSKSTIKTPK